MMGPSASAGRPSGLASSSLRGRISLVNYRILDFKCAIALLAASYCLPKCLLMPIPAYHASIADGVYHRQSRLADMIGPTAPTPYRISDSARGCSGAALHRPTHVELAESSVDLLEPLSRPPLFEAVIQRGEDARAQLTVFPLFQTEAVDLPLEIFQECKGDLVAPQPQAHLGQVAARGGSGRGRWLAVAMARSSRATASAPRPASARAAACGGDLDLGLRRQHRATLRPGSARPASAGTGSVAACVGAKKALALEPEPRLCVGRRCSIIELGFEQVGEVAKEHAQEASAAERGVLAIGSLQRLDRVAVGVEPAPPFPATQGLLGLLERLLPSPVSDRSASVPGGLRSRGPAARSRPARPARAYTSPIR